MRSSASHHLLAGSLLAGAMTMLLLTGCSHTTTSHEDSLDDGQPSASTPSGDALSISKMGGDIDVDDAANGASLHTMGGNIDVNKAEKSLWAETMGGNISVHSSDVTSLVAKSMGGNIDISSAKALELRATTMGGNVTVQTLGDGTIYLKSMGGNIDLTIPKTASAQVDVEVDYTGLTDQGHTITDNLGLQQQKSSSWELWRLTHRYHISARGSIGSGTNRIVIKTVGGDVTLNSQ